ncbi:MAG: hypothetical protein AAB769_00990 [Patescibacteria group bacterium]
MMPMQPMSIKKRRFYFYTLLVVFFLIIPIIILYTSGYRVKGFHLVETGGIYIYSPEANSIIYLDNNEEHETSVFQKDYFVQNLTPGTYSVLIAKDGFWPWIKEVSVEERVVSEAIAFLIPKDPESAVIPKTTSEIVVKKNGATTTIEKANQEYKDALLLFKMPPAGVATTTLSGASTTEKISGRGRVGLWQEDNRILARWLKDADSLPNYFCRGEICNDMVIVFSSPDKIRNFDFYPGREDVILLAVQTGVYAIEIDTRKAQNFQPVYKGADPKFIVSGNTLYIKDGDNIFRVAI